MLDITKRMDLLRMPVEELRDILNDILRKDPNASISFSDSYMGGGGLHYDTERESYFFSNENMTAKYRQDIYYDSFDLFKNYDEAKRNHIIDCIIDQYPEELVSKYTPSFEEAKLFAKYFNEEDFNNALYNIALANLFGENRDTFNILQRYGYGFEQRLIASEAFKEYVANGKEYWEKITEEEIEKRVEKVQKEYDESWDKAFNKKTDEVVTVNMMQGFNEKDICTLCKAITTLDEKYINFATDYLKLKPVTMAWKVYGKDGHRQRESFNYSYKVDLYRADQKNGTLEVLNSDVTYTNDYTIIKITKPTKKQCIAEFEGQLTDGVFENSVVGITEPFENIENLPEVKYNEEGIFVEVIDYNGFVPKQPKQAPTKSTGTRK